MTWLIVGRIFKVVYYVFFNQTIKICSLVGSVAQKIVIKCKKSFLKPVKLIAVELLQKLNLLKASFASLPFSKRSWLLFLFRYQLKPLTRIKCNNSLTMRILDKFLRHWLGSIKIIFYILGGSSICHMIIAL